MTLPEHLGRLRVNQAEAKVIYRLVGQERFALLWARQIALGEGDDIHAYQRQLVHLKKIYDELDLLAEQKGWDIGQSVNTNPQGTDPGVPTAPSRRVG